MKCKLPVDVESITYLGMNPLTEWSKHRGCNGLVKCMEYAWDFAVDRNTPIHAVADGYVYLADTKSDREPTLSESRFLLEACVDGWTDEANALADRLYEHTNKIIIDHGGVFSLYAHLRKDGSVVVPGEKVIAGQLIGYSGNTGCSTEPHLHFELFRPRADLSPIFAVDGTDDDRRTSIPAEFDEEKRLMDFMK